MELRYLGDFKLAMLCDELFDAFPEWRIKEGADYVTSVVIAETLDGVLIQGLPDDVDVAAVNKAIKKHDHGKPSKREKKEAKKQADRDSAKSKLKALGLTDEELEALLGG